MFDSVEVSTSLASCRGRPLLPVNLKGWLSKDEQTQSLLLEEGHLVPREPHDPSRSPTFHSSSLQLLAAGFSELGVVFTFSWRFQHGQHSDFYNYPRGSSILWHLRVHGKSRGQLGLLAWMNYRNACLRRMFCCWYADSIASSQRMRVRMLSIMIKSLCHVHLRPDTRLHSRTSSTRGR